ncbi:MAG: hypothetical protein CMJ24_10165 [Phycisphaerae bacterium]|nr:hypothetical protein [Phycisphaerae bacterium]
MPPFPYCMLLISWCLGVLETPPADVLLPDGGDVLVLGDGFAEELSERRILEELYASDGGADVVFHHHGASGVEVNGLPLPSDLAMPRPDVVFICVGMIDSIRGADHLRVFENDLRNRIDGWDGSRVVLLTPIPPEPSSDAHAYAAGRFADVMFEVAADTESHVIDLHGPLRIAGRNGSLTHDGMHLSDAGWDLVDGELSWQLGRSTEDPSWKLPSSNPATPAHSSRMLEVRMREDPGLLPVLPVGGPREAAATTQPIPSWDDSKSLIDSFAAGDDSIRIEDIRSAMNRLLSEPGRESEAVETIRPLTGTDRPTGTRLQALASLDDAGVESDSTDVLQTIRMKGVPVKMVYDIDRFDVVAGRPVRIILDNPDAQPHNLLILKPGSLRAIGRAVDGMGNTAEARARHWVPESPKILHAMPMVAPDEVGELLFIAPERPGRYPFVCTYPGHWRMMNGVMTVRAEPKD